MSAGSTVDLDNGSWTLGEQLGKGGFGEVYRGFQGTDEAAIKFIPKDSGTPREVLLDIPVDARNVVPITGTGEDDKNWIIAMPLADDTLEHVIGTLGGKLPEQLALAVLTDISDALASLHGKIVHRDIKPGNILLLNNKWCLSDFGIARYAEVATGTQTHKGYGSLPYIAPEIWRGESATSRSDMYALGVVAYEIVTGSRPFSGTDEEVRHGHLNVTPPPSGAPSRLDWAIMDCLKKMPTLRPTAEQFNDKLEPSAAVFASQAALALGQANQEQRNLRDLAEQQFLAALAEDEARGLQVDHASDLLSRISGQVLAKLQDFADFAALHPTNDDGWKLTLGRATLTFSDMIPNHWGHFMTEEDDPFVVLARAVVTLQQQQVGFQGNPGRSHALWYADVEEEGRFQWYETAFYQNDGMSPCQRLVPYAAEFESTQASKALRGDTTYLVAWPFTPLDADDVTEFLERWALWFAQASNGELNEDYVEDIRRARESWRNAPSKSGSHP